MARGMMIDRDALGIKSATIAGTWVLAKLINACLVGRALGICFTFREDHVSCE